MEVDFVRLPKFLTRNARNLIGSILQFFGLGVMVHDFWLECGHISTPLRLHGFWAGTCLLITGWIVLLLEDLIGE